MRVVAFDPFVSAERFRELGVEQAETSDRALRASRTSSRSTCPRRPRRAAGSTPRRSRKCKRRRADHQLRARRAGRRRRRSRTRSTPARSPAPRSTCSRREPITDHPLFGYPNVVVTPHLARLDDRGAGPRRRADRRAGRRRADRRRRLDRRQHPGGQRRGHGGARPVPAARPAASAASAMALAESASVDRVEVEYLGRIAERDTRLLTLSVLNGVLAGHTEEEVNLVNAPSLAEERGIEVVRAQGARSRATSPTSCASPSSPASERTRVVGTTLGHQHRPHLLEAWGQRFNLQIDERPPRAVPLLRRARHGRPRRHRVRRARRQHLVRRRRPRAARRRRTSAATWR